MPRCGPPVVEPAEAARQGEERAEEQQADAGQPGGNAGSGAAADDADAQGEDRQQGGDAERAFGDDRGRCQRQRSARFAAAQPDARGIASDDSGHRQAAEDANQVGPVGGQKGVVEVDRRQQPGPAQRRRQEPGERQEPGCSEPAEVGGRPHAGGCRPVDQRHDSGEGGAGDDELQPPQQATTAAHRSASRDTWAAVGRRPATAAPLIRRLADAARRALPAGSTAAASRAAVGPVRSP